ncbi:hypothetical protein BT96DRAFT_348945 [Gymnopus androsaceus JB14]|uniref:Uncharacterized protein n=1 Tax=Gymnopus androsaceus JB14 TaxID=1447944 RepID=A0A6A4I5Z9_9AGAR|nr:hypothetical protein BT96DRAFT_348945 [Gymnopus androsaceus JB14]
MRSMRYLLLLLAFITKMLADEFVTPGSWKGTNITASTADRQSTVQASIQQVINNGTANASVDFFSILAMYDFYNNQTSFKEPVTAYFSTSSFSSSEFLMAQ